MYVGAYLILGHYPAKTVLPDCQTGTLDIFLSFPILIKYYSPHPKGVPLRDFPENVMEK